MTVEDQTSVRWLKVCAITNGLSFSKLVNPCAFLLHSLLNSLSKVCTLAFSSSESGLHCNEILS